MVNSKMFVLIAAVAAGFAAPAQAHCDGIDGPVAKAARSALQRGDVKPALAWVQPDGEREVRAAFDKAVAVRRLGGDAAALAETYFLETVVRLHRAGEGAPYTGLQPAGRDLGPAIPAADEAVATGSAEHLAALLGGAVQRGLADRFREVVRLARFDPADVGAGRAYVKAYVEFLHYAERVSEAAGPAKHAHDER